MSAGPMVPVHSREPLPGGRQSVAGAAGGGAATPADAAGGGGADDPDAGPDTGDPDGGDPDVEPGDVQAVFVTEAADEPRLGGAWPPADGVPPAGAEPPGDDTAGALAGD